MRQRTLWWSSWAQLLVVLINAVVGGITVWTGLNPYVVAGHFLAAMLLLTSTAISYDIAHRHRHPARTAAHPSTARHRCWGDMVLLLATTGMRISEVSGLVVGDVDLKAGLIYVRRQRYPGRGGLIIKPTKGRRNRVVPIIGPGRETLERLTAGGRPDAPLLVGPRGGTITTATLRDATGWDKLVRGLGIAGLVRHGLRHTALTWIADSGVALHVLQRVAGHQDPAMTARYLHPDHRALTDAGEAFGAWWTQNGHKNGREETGEDDAEKA